jgi:predicted glutamine amidotransferase
MCRLFFSFRNKTITLLLKEFLAQSANRSKNTPTIDNPRDYLTHTDGFGIAWKATNEADWDIYKQPVVYTKDHCLDAILDTIPNNLVIGHIRKKTQGNVSMENTHPFHYDGQVFVQNGKIADFKKYSTLLRSYITHSVIGKIKGETDTEFLFFMFLSCKKYLENRAKYIRKDNTRKNYTTPAEFSESQIELYEKTISKLNSELKQVQYKHSLYINAFSVLTAIFIEHNIELVANIIYANSDIVLLSRYIYYDKTIYKEKQMPNSLYLNICKPKNSGILITSEPLSGYDCRLFPENTISILDYKNYDFVIQNI